MIFARDWYIQSADTLIQYVNNNTPSLGVGVIIAPYTPASTLTMDDLTWGTGSLARIEQTAVNMESGLDPSSGQYKLIAAPNEGGWLWNYNGVAPAPPVTIYGYGLCDVIAPGGILWAVSQPLAQPILLSRAGLVVLGEMSGLMALQLCE